MGLSQAREIAYDVFIQVMKNQEHPEDVLELVYTSSKGRVLKRIDKNFIKELLFGSLRWYYKIFWILQNTSKRDLNNVSWEVRAALILGTYQIFYMDKVPDRAAVNESVEYVRQKGQAAACSFVNGILRQIARRVEYFPKPDKDQFPIEYLSLQYSHPKWIVRRWLNVFKFSQVEKILEANNSVPPCTIRINTLKVSLDNISAFQQKLLKQEQMHTDKRYLRCSLRCKQYPNVDVGSFFDQGYYTIQDESSQLIGFLVNPQPDEVIVDACCGPGGKLSHIYELSQGKVHIIAIDRSLAKFQKAQQTMQRLGHDKNIEWIHTDFFTWDMGAKKADKILLDASCSALGVLRRHPEGKWFKKENCVVEYAQYQKQLILHALKNLKKDGELIYSVCSFEEEESRQHVNWLLSEFASNIEQVSPVSRLPAYFKKYVTRDNILLVYTGNQDEMDGFGAFIVKLKQPIDV